MTGIDKILSKIKEDANAVRQGILADAQAQADKTIAEAKQEAAAHEQAILAKATADADALIKRAHSSAKLEQNKTLLCERVAIISEILAEAATTLSAMPAASYFPALESLALSHAQNGSGTMLLSETDLQRLPQDFAQKLGAQLAAKGAALTIGQGEITGGGFILVYGDVEINCTFTALLEANREELKDKLSTELFSAVS